MAEQAWSMKDLWSKRNQDKADNLEREKEAHFARSVANQNATLTSINLVPRAFPKKNDRGAPLIFLLGKSLGDEVELHYTCSRDLP